MSRENPFKYYKTSLEIIKLAVMYYVRYPLSLRQVEDILHEHQRHIENRHNFKNLRQRSVDLWQEIYA